MTDGPEDQPVLSPVSADSGLGPLDAILILILIPEFLYLDSQS